MEARPDTPTILVVFGATGDLMARKIAPALFHLFERGRLPERFEVVGFGRRDLGDEGFRDHVTSILATRRDLASSEAYPAFLQAFCYEQGSFDDESDYRRLGERLRAVDAGWETCANKLFYLAVPPHLYRGVFEHLAASGLTRGCAPDGGWTRVLVEKPFGKDAATAQELDELLGSLFAEEQIYRIDHYLAKEMLQGILDFRFANNLLEPSWHRGIVERIDVSLMETVGVEDRGTFYDGVGALRDVGQNHLLQMLALVTMDRPEDRSAAAIRAARIEAIRALHVLAPNEVEASTVRAQYRGYRDVEGVRPDSGTETYFRLATRLSSDRWRGTPVTMQAGKRVGGVCKDIVVTLRHPTPCLCEDAVHHRNRVVFTLEPDESIRMRFRAKRPGLGRESEERDLVFMLYEKEDRTQYVEEYARLLLDCVTGDQTLFVSTEEVRAMWAFTDPVVRVWAEGRPSLREYDPETPERELVALGASEPPEVEVVRREVGVVGLGKMGANLARNLVRNGWRVVGFNRSPGKTQALESEGVAGAYSLREAVERLRPPRVVWLMLPAGEAVDGALFGDEGLLSLLEPGDTVIEGGNSHYKDTRARAERFAGTGIAFVDAGVSGGPRGALEGACLMIGGEREPFERLATLWSDVAVEEGVAFFPGAGAGHFVKMVHNGIEYGMMQAIAEGFDILHASDYDIDLARAAEVYQHGSVIESRLVGWLREALEVRGIEMEGVSGSVGHTGEGAWTVEAARELGVKAFVIEGALAFRRESELDPSYAGRLLSAMRNAFGGHALAEAPAEASAEPARR